MSPKGSGKKDSDKKQLFIISPIGQTGSETRKYFDKVRKHVIEKVASEMGYKTTRADNISRPGRITKQIVERLRTDDLVIADLTHKNPNVFYELAVRHAVGKPVILMGAIGDDIPFDVAAQRVIFYDLDPDNIEEARQELTRQISAVESDKFIVDSPIESSIPLERSRRGDTEQERIVAILRNQSRQLQNIEEALSVRFKPFSHIVEPETTHLTLVEAIERCLKEKSIQSVETGSYLASIKGREGTATSDCGSFLRRLKSVEEPVKLFVDPSASFIWFIKGNSFYSWRFAE